MSAEDEDAFYDEDELIDEAYDYEETVADIASDNGSQFSYVVILFLISLFVAAGILIFKKLRWEKSVNDMAWKLPENEIDFTSETPKPGLKIGKDRESTLSLEAAKLGHYEVGAMKGVPVSIKFLNVNKIEITRELLVELKQLRDCQNNNLVRFLGAVMQEGRNFLISEYCKKGSLQDILCNENLKLDWTFRLSMLKDIIKGMEYLHGSDIKFHGRLTSRNCVVDGRFVTKVADFGLHCLREIPREVDEEEDFCAQQLALEQMLFAAPEHLLDNCEQELGSQKGDIYSFGILISEIINRSPPYHLARENISLREIISKVRGREKPPFRPDVMEKEIPQGLVAMMTTCWAESPEERPTFSMLGRDINSIEGGKEQTMIDALIHRMETYANNLEDIVKERTLELMMEKKKTDDLLYQILPKTVADQLKAGKHVTPVTYDNVTIYFSDVVGFTSLASDSAPTEIVTFLNDMYTTFDSIIDNFDVYKVETIGDAYMVVSGLPVKNGTKHASEIARMAVTIIKKISVFKIAHRPGETLKIRVGIHSGACCAGVVGLKRPRYCLFGDTVNVASRMESSGMPLKIHMSETTKTILDMDGGYEVEVRGTIEIKGKGNMKTYWLLGTQKESVPSSTRLITEVATTE